MKNWAEEFGLINLTRLKQSDHEVSRRVADGVLRKLTAEVVMDAELYEQLPPWDRAAARAFAVGLTVDKAVVSGQAAARLWGLHTLTIEDSVSCYLPDGRTPSSPKQWPPGVVYRYGHMDPKDVHEYHGIRVASFTRFFLDIAHYEGVHAAVVVVDSARRQFPELTEEFLLDRLKAFPRYRGLTNLRRAIELSIPNSDSAQETRARIILHEAQLPGINSVQPQVRFHRGTTGRFHMVDFLINGWIIVEIDGRSKYNTGSPEELETALMAERDREKFLTNHGYMVLRIDPKQLDAPPGAECEFLRILRRALEQEPPTHLQQAA